MRERGCVLTHVTFSEPDRDLSVNVMTYGDGTARVYDRDDVDPRLTGAAFNRGKASIDVPYFATVHEAIEHLLAVNGPNTRTPHTVQITASEVAKRLNVVDPKS